MTSEANDSAIATSSEASRVQNSAVTTDQPSVRTVSVQSTDASDVKGSSGVGTKTNRAIKNGSNNDAAQANSTPDPATAGIQKSSKRKKKPPLCKFFGTKKGCRAGASCPFRHDVQQSSVATQANEKADSTETPAPAPQQPMPAPMAPTKLSVREYADPRPPTLAVRASQKPVAEAEKQDPRAFQIKQIQRRFNPKEEMAPNGDTLLYIEMKPSDPDFPFDIDSLNCTLRLPAGFPQNKRPSVRVTNNVMERGYQLNVEQGFDAIWSQSAAPTLLNAFKALDKRLEALLTGQKAETIKIVAPTAASRKPKPPAAITIAKEQDSAQKSVAPPQPASKPVSAPITPQRRQQARDKRATEVQILEHRLGRDPQFSKAAGDTLFTVPMEPRKRSDLPPSMRAVRAVRLLVPTDYDLEPCSIEVVGVHGDDAVKVEQAFGRRARSHPDATLLAQINYIAANMHLMAKDYDAGIGSQAIGPAEPRAAIPTATASTTNDIAALTTASKELEVRSTDKEHVKVISRPPEWDMVHTDEGEDSGTEGSYSYDSGDEDGDLSDIDEDEQATEQPQSTSTPQERGIMLSFPGLELYGIELLELTIINTTVKCDRCKDTLDVSRLRPQQDASTTASDPKTKDNTLHTSCKKCAYPFTLAYRKDLLHTASTRAGYLDLDGCTVVDLLPSSFIPTCSACSTPFPASQPVTATRAQSALAICRTTGCHSKLSFLFREVKFLRVHAGSNLPLKQVGRPKKETLGLVTGTELPKHGTCKHYSKSYRWFRFSCCNKVYPCDRCHDDAEEHPNEFASRMVCGWCSREQPYKPEECGICRKGITGRVRSGFWEGGKGTRDKSKMSRKDPRKFKRRGGGAVRKGLGRIGT